MLENKLFIFDWSYWAKRNRFLGFLFGNTLFFEDNFWWLFFNRSLIFLFWNILIILIDHLIRNSIDLKMFKIKASNQLLSCKLKSFFCDFDKLLIMLDNFFDMDFKFSIHFFCIDVSFVWHLLNNTDDFAKHVRSGFFNEGHQIFDFFLFWLVDYHFVSIIHVKVEFISKLVMIEKSVIDFDEAVILVFGFLVLSEELSNVFIGLKILIFEFLKPFFSLFDTDLFHGEQMSVALNNQGKF